MQTHTSNTLTNNNSNATSVASDSLDASVAVKVTNMLEALTTAFGGWSQIDNTDIARAIAGNIRNQGWGRYKTLDVVCECAAQYGARWNMTDEHDKEMADETFALAELTGVEDAVFCHPGLFIGGARSKEGAVELAYQAVLIGTPLAELTSAPPRE